MAPLSRSIFGLLVASAVSFPSVMAGNERLCSIPPITYAGAKTTYPDAAFALTELEKRGIATWYSDREANGDYVQTATQLVSQCDSDSRLTVVVYGLPNKDCEAGYSTEGSRVKTPADYEKFVGTLASIIGQRKVLYVLEPDAVGLLAKEDNGCAAQSGYKDNLKTAVRLLSANPNAEIYVDVGYWTLAYPTQCAKVASIIRELGYSGRIKGITLNTSNYRSNGELSGLCSNFQNAIGNYDMRCIIDTSRNYNGASSDEWCNLKTAGIGHPPTGDTGLSNIDYFVWVKPPGDSDGSCKSGRTADAMIGPDAGEFFYQSFSALWAQGYLVQQEKMPRVGEYSPPTPAPTPAPTPVPTTPEPTTEAPTPEPTTVTPTPTPEPTTAAPVVVSSSSSGSSSASADEIYQQWLNETTRQQQLLQQQKQNETAVPTPAPTTMLPSGGTNTESKSSSSSTQEAPVAFLTVMGVAVAALVVALVLRTRRRRLAAQVEVKSPRGSFVSMRV